MIKKGVGRVVDIEALDVEEGDKVGQCEGVLLDRCAGGGVGEGAVCVWGGGTWGLCRDRSVDQPFGQVHGVPVSWRL